MLAKCPYANSAGIVRAAEPAASPATRERLPHAVVTPMPATRSEYVRMIAARYAASGLRMPRKTT